MKVTLEIEVEAQPFRGEEIPPEGMPSTQEIMKAWVQQNGGQLCSYKEIAENGGPDVTVSMTLLNWKVEGSPEGKDGVLVHDRPTSTTWRTSARTDLAGIRHGND